MLDKITKGVAFLHSLEKVDVDVGIASVLSAIKTLDSAKDLESLGIKDLNNWSRKEKNIFSILVKNNPHIQDIVYFYNNALESSSIINRTDLFRKLNTINKFLKAHPYNQDNFEKKVYENVISWETTGETNKTTTLLDGLKKFIDKNTLSDFMGISVEKRDAATALINSKKIISIKNMDNNIYSVGLSTIGALLFTSQTFSTVLSSELARTVTPYFTNILGDTPLVGTLAVLAVGAIAVKKTFDVSYTFIKKVREQSLNFSVIDEKPQQFTEKYAKEHMSASFLSNLMTNQEYDLTNKDNKKYLSLITFLNEKIFNKNTKVNQKMIDDLSLSKQQVNKLNTLNITDIQELSNLKSERARSLMALNTLNSEQKYIIKNLDIIDVLNNKKSSSHPFDMKEPDNISQLLKTRLSKMSPLDKELTVYYLAVNSNKDNQCSSSVITNLGQNLSQGEPLRNLLFKETSSAVRGLTQRLVIENKNHIVDALKRIWDGFTGKDTLTHKNVSVCKTLEYLSKEYSYTNSNSIITSQMPISQKIIQNTSKVLENLKNLRESLANSIGNSRQP